MSSFSRPFGNQGYRPPPRKPFQQGRGLSVTEIMGQRENHATGYDENNQPLAPGTQFYSQGWNAKFGPRQGGGRIGSASGAVGSAGIPTSQRGRAEKFGSMGPNGQFQPNYAAAQTPTWAMSQMVRDQGGLSQSQRYSTMGQFPMPQQQGYGADGPLMMEQNNPWADRTTFGPNASSTYMAPPAEQQQLYNPTLNPIQPASLYDGTDAAYLRRKRLYA